MCRKIISQKYPDYILSFDKVMNGKKACMCNMFIMRKELLNEYCNWLFDILFELEEKIDISDRDDYQKRVFGFISERLFNVWIEKKSPKTKFLPVYMVNEKPIVVKLKSIIKKIIHK